MEQGSQEWGDGSRYEGQFLNGLRHGRGRHSWANGEVYEGEYVRDQRHGHGVYSWPCGVYFRGHFADDLKEGWGEYTAPHRERFQGVYHCGERSGPGTLTYYPSGRQDVGVWRGGRLARLRFPVIESSFDPFTEAGSLSSSLGSGGQRSRGNAGPKGPLEIGSEELIRAAALGDVAKVTKIVETGAINVDVEDSLGHTALFSAAVHGESAVVDVLLDHGADVNHLDDNGVSLLSACYHQVYSPLPQVQRVFKLLPLPRPLSPVTTPTNCKDCVLLSSNHNLPQPVSAPESGPGAGSNGDGPTQSELVSKSLVEFGLAGRESGDPAAARSCPLLSGLNPLLSTSSPHTLTDGSYNKPAVLKPPREVDLIHHTPTSLGNSATSNPLHIMPHTPLSHDLLVPLPLQSHDSSVISSSRYGAIVSAAESTSLSCDDHMILSFDGLLSDSTSSKSADTAEESSSRSLLPDVATLLLDRGADPNLSPSLLPPLVYTILAGDVRGAHRLLERGALLSAPLSDDLGGLLPLHLAVTHINPHTPDMVQCLLTHGADPNCQEGSTGEGACPSDDSDVSMAGGEKERDREDLILIGGEREGGRGFTPLHLICATTVSGATDDNLLSEVSVCVVELLISGGADVNMVCKGHSPLSLAIVNGHDELVEVLLESGADPNLPLGRGVCSSLCALSTLKAHRHRDHTATAALVRKLVERGGDVLMPVRLCSGGQVGTVVDFAHAALQQDKRLSCIKQCALNGTERTQYKAAKKLIQLYGNIFKSRALLNLLAKEEHWQKVHQPVVDAEDSPSSNQLRRTMSAVPPVCKQGSRPYSELRGERVAQSAGSRPRKAQTSLLSLSLPQRSLRAALESVEEMMRGHLEGEGGRHSRLVDVLRRVGTLLPTTSNTEWSLASFCYECGRSVGVILVSCHGCRSIKYCSKSCRAENWKRGHQLECTGALVANGNSAKRNKSSRV